MLEGKQGDSKRKDGKRNFGWCVKRIKKFKKEERKKCKKLDKISVIFSQSVKTILKLKLYVYAYGKI